MKNIFGTPDIEEGFENFTHTGGIQLPQNQALITYQESLLRHAFQLNGDRRQEFINLTHNADSDYQHELRIILESIAREVAAHVEAITQRSVTINKKISGIWIEGQSCKTNEQTHRDTHNPRTVRATFSVAPTKILPKDVSIPIAPDEWDTHHYPMGPLVLPREYDNLNISGPLGGTQIMTGTTYHRAPNPNEIAAEFKDLFGQSINQTPRIFGSIWGTLN